jgi:hypothetical protein
MRKRSNILMLVAAVVLAFVAVACFVFSGSETSSANASNKVSAVPSSGAGPSGALASGRVLPSSENGEAAAEGFDAAKVGDGQVVAGDGATLFSAESAGTSASDGDDQAAASSNGASSGDNTSDGNARSATSLSGDTSDGGQSAASSGDSAPEGNTATLAIDCYTILNNMGTLTKGKEGLVGSGLIMPARTVSFEDGETVFDVLQRECRASGIHMESSFTPLYNSAYIEGINNLYEFDCGSLSGWTYKVNGWFPNYGCSQYYLEDGDVIEWRYTCDLGADVGGLNAVGN